jgi:hypothetical protein
MITDTMFRTYALIFRGLLLKEGNIVTFTNYYRKLKYSFERFQVLTAASMKETLLGRFAM